MWPGDRRVRGWSGRSPVQEPRPSASVCEPKRRLGRGPVTWSPTAAGLHVRTQPPGHRRGWRPGAGGGDGDVGCRTPQQRWAWGTSSSPPHASQAAARLWVPRGRRSGGPAPTPPHLCPPSPTLPVVEVRAHGWGGAAGARGCGAPSAGTELMPPSAMRRGLRTLHSEQTVARTGRTLTSLLCFAEKGA